MITTFFTGYCSKLARGAVLVVVGCVVCDCGANDVPETGLPSTFESQNGNYIAELGDNDVHRGENDIEICLTDAMSGEPAEELVLETVPFMPSMGHGSSGASRSVALGGGCYLFDGLAFTMPGTWELRTDILSEPQDYVALLAYVD